MASYQHSDEVIEAARILQDQLIKDSPFGNEDDALDWFHQNYAQVACLARQYTISESRMATEVEQ